MYLKNMKVEGVEEVEGVEGVEGVEKLLDFSKFALSSLY
jgi:hypothetical protein